MNTSLIKEIKRLLPPRVYVCSRYCRIDSLDKLFWDDVAFYVYLRISERLRPTQLFLVIVGDKNYYHQEIYNKNPLIKNIDFSKLISTEGYEYFDSSSHHWQKWPKFKHLVQYENCLRWFCIKKEKLLTHTIPALLSLFQSYNIPARIYKNNLQVQNLRFCVDPNENFISARDS